MSVSSIRAFESPPTGTTVPPSSAALPGATAVSVPGEEPVTPTPAPVNVPTGTLPPVQPASVPAVDTFLNTKSLAGEIQSQEAAELAAVQFLVDNYKQLAPGGGSGDKYGDGDLGQAIDMVNRSNAGTETARQWVGQALGVIRDNRDALADVFSGGRDDKNLDLKDLSLIRENLATTQFTLRDIAGLTGWVRGYERAVSDRNMRWNVGGMTPIRSASAAIGIYSTFFVSPTPNQIIISDKQGNPLRLAGTVDPLFNPSGMGGGHIIA